MKIITDTNLFFDSDHPACGMQIEHGTGGRLFAFVQSVDGGPDGQACIIRRTWGEWDPDDARRSLIRIMKYGPTWPDLPPAPPLID